MLTLLKPHIHPSLQHLSKASRACRHGPEMRGNKICETISFGTHGLVLTTASWNIRSGRAVRQAGRPLNAKRKFLFNRLSVHLHSCLKWPRGSFVSQEQAGNSAKESELHFLYRTCRSRCIDVRGYTSGQALSSAYTPHTLSNTALTDAYQRITSAFSLGFFTHLPAHTHSLSTGLLHTLASTHAHTS